MRISRLDRSRIHPSLQPIQPMWNHFPLLIATAFAARVVVALYSEVAYHPDETMQYLEQAHRLAFGYGLIPWEYRFGLRSWIIPGFLSFIMSASAILGSDKPQIYIAATKIVLCAVSLSIPICFYLFSRRLLSESIARWASVFTAFWYEIVYFAHKPLADVLIFYPWCMAMAIAVNRSTMPRGIAFGAFTAVILAIRIQFAPAIAVVWLTILFCWPWRQLWMCAFGLSATLLVIGWFDQYTWGIWFAPSIINYYMNIDIGVAGGFGLAKSYYYAAALLITTGGLFAVSVGGFALEARKAWPLWMTVLAVIIPLTFIIHKEHRFQFSVIRNIDGGFGDHLRPPHGGRLTCLGKDQGISRLSLYHSGVPQRLILAIAAPRPSALPTILRSKRREPGLPSDGAGPGRSRCLRCSEHTMGGQRWILLPPPSGAHLHAFFVAGRQVFRDEHAPLRHPLAWKSRCSGSAGVSFGAAYRFGCHLAQSGADSRQSGGTRLQQRPLRCPGQESYSNCHTTVVTTRTVGCAR
jgi:glycosyl transferase family 22 (putative mannosyltransferase)